MNANLRYHLRAQRAVGYFQLLFGNDDCDFVGGRVFQKIEQGRRRRGHESAHPVVRTANVVAQPFRAATAARVAGLKACATTRCGDESEALYRIAPFAP